jgi:SpoVK/Ycf46/Vps4 family AAA+-type ATPase
MIIYQNNLEHLLEELHRIDLIVRLNLKNMGQDDFQGLYISEKEINALLQTPPYQIRKNDILDQDIEKIQALASKINRKKNESIKNGKELRLHVLSEIFHLNPFEVDTILICLASELDLRYEKLYSYMNNDVTRKRPTVDLVKKMLCSSIEENIRVREYFSSRSPLIKNKLISLGSDGQDLPIISRYIKINEKIISFLLGIDDVDPGIEKFSSIIKPKISVSDIISEDNQRLICFIEQISSSKTPLIFFLHGGYGTGKKMLAEVICRERGKSLLIVNASIFMKDESREMLDVILREALLQNSYVYLEGIDVLRKEKDWIDVTNQIRKMDGFPEWIFLSGELPWEPPRILENHKYINIPFPLPSFALRIKLWNSFLDGNSDGIDICALATKFKFSGGQIKDAIFSAFNAASARGMSKMSMEDIYYGCKSQSNRNLSEFARKIEPQYTWDDIVLPKDTKEQLREVCGHIKDRGVVYTDWGFENKLSLGKGLNVLFSGPSGTGKTMAAEIIAKDSGLDLFKIDLSNVVSKYIGETEKNLKNIFLEAETSNSILFFDEADALFGKRSEVRDSHDRYANIEIDYLLQKMEEYEGIVILATNIRKNIDDAFLRRIHFVIEFPLPEEEYREKIWMNIFPVQTPIDSIDFAFLSRLKITGGNIKNIALSAAFMAADNSSSIKMEHIIRATRREFQKIGKLCEKRDFGKYYELLEKMKNG